MDLVWCAIAAVLSIVLIVELAVWWPVPGEIWRIRRALEALEERSRPPAQPIHIKPGEPDWRKVREAAGKSEW